MTYWINPSSYVYREKGDAGSDVCMGAFYPLDVPKRTRLWIAGDTFLSSYYSVYNFGCWENPGVACQVGLAAKSMDILLNKASSVSVPDKAADSSSAAPKAVMPSLTHDIGLAGAPKMAASAK